MNILSNVSVPQEVVLNGVRVKASKRTDLLLGAPIVQVHAVKPTADKSVCGKAIAINPVNGERIAIMGFGENAHTISRLQVGESYNFSGNLRGFANSQFGQTFRVNEILSEDVFVGAQATA